MILLLSVVLALAPLSRAQVCEDIDETICKEIFALDPTFCSTACFSSSVCPRTCGKCPLKCYDCHEVNDPKSCSTVTQCPSRDHFCITTQSFDDDFNDRFKLGCALNSICAEHLQTKGRRQTQIQTEVIQLKGSCCTQDLCNQNLLNMSATQPSQPIISTKQPASVQPLVTAGFNTTSSLSTANPSIAPSSNPSPSVPVSIVASVQPVTSVMVGTTLAALSTSSIRRRSSICHDVTTDICGRLQKNLPNMCSNDCIANEVCPRTCRKCISCLDCAHVSDPANCTQETVCERGEQCLSVETLSATFERGFKLGCIDEKICSTFGQTAPGTFGKRQGYELFVHGGCCNQELCNKHSLQSTSNKPATIQPSTSQPSTTSLPTTKMATAKPPTTTRTVRMSTTTMRPTTTKITLSTAKLTQQTAAAVVTTLYPCKDYDNSGYCTQFGPIICKTTDPASKKFALSNCALTCNECDEFYDYLARGEITIQP